MTWSCFRFLACWFVPYRKMNKHVFTDNISIVVRELLIWLLFRLMFSSGIVKLTSGCPTWWSLTALDHHFQTQPLPVALAWWVHNQPAIIKQIGVAITYVIECVFPYLFYVPYRHLRIFGGLAQIALMLMIMATGNYNFFNILTIVK